MFVAVEFVDCKFFFLFFSLIQEKEEEEKNNLFGIWLFTTCVCEWVSVCAVYVAYDKR